MHVVRICQLVQGMPLAILLAAGVIPAVVALIVLPAVVHRRRRAQRYALMAAMAVAVQRQIPMIPVLLAFSTERRGYVARKAMDLAARLQAGWALPDAVDSVRGLFPPQIRLAIRMGHDSGNLAAVLRDVSDESDATDAVEAQITGKFCGPGAGGQHDLAAGADGNSGTFFLHECELTTRSLPLDCPGTVFS